MSHKNNQKPKWIEEEKRILIKYYSDMNFNKLKEMLPLRTKSAIKREANILKLTRKSKIKMRDVYGRIIGYDIAKDKLIDLYQTQKMSIAEIGRHLGIGYNAVRNHLIKDDIPIRSRSNALAIAHQKYPEMWRFTEERSKRQSERLKKHPINYWKGKHTPQSAKEKLSKYTTECWKDPDYREKRVKAILRGMKIRPNNSEKKLINIFHNNNLPFRYVGNGEIIIGRANPDFIHNSERRVIELFSRSFHDPAFSFFEISWNRQYFGRMAYYANYGYACLIIWEEELENEQNIIKKITKYLSEQAPILS